LLCLLTTVHGLTFRHATAAVALAVGDNDDDDDDDDDDDKDDRFQVRTGEWTVVPLSQIY
jgi:hypothetical protein